MLAMGRTGEQVKESGTYKNAYGKELVLNTGDSFPTCPKEGKPISWEKID